jgi:hypothetical protein
MICDPVSGDGLPQAAKCLPPLFTPERFFHSPAVQKIAKVTAKQTRNANRCRALSDLGGKANMAIVTQKQNLPRLRDRLRLARFMPPISALGQWQT